jgi:hypothetical protein
MVYYSGKKKRHVVKTQIMVNNRSGFIIHKTVKMKGHRHDYDIYKNNHPLLLQNKLLMCLTLDI